MGEPYAKFIEAQLANELARRDSVNSRATTALTSATGLITLALAVLAVLRGKDFVLNSGQPKMWLIVAMSALFISAVCAVGAGVPWKIQLIQTSTFDAMVGRYWNHPDDKALRRVAYANKLLIESLQKGTARKYWFFLISGIAQIVAVFALAACVLAVALTPPPNEQQSSTCWWATYCRWGDQRPGHHRVAVTTSASTATPPASPRSISTTSAPRTVNGLG